MRLRSIVPGLVRLLDFLLTGSWFSANMRSSVAGLARFSKASVEGSISISPSVTSRADNSPTKGCSRLAPIPPEAS